MRKKTYTFALLALCGNFALASNSTKEQEPNSGCAGQTENLTKREARGVIGNTQTITVRRTEAGEMGSFAGGGLLYRILSGDNKTVAAIGISKEITNKEDYAGEILVPAYIKCDGETYTVTQLFGAVFKYMESMTGVSLPTTLQVIGNSFEGCSSLRSIAIPNSVTTIGEDAFRYCTSLTSVEIPNSVTQLGGGAFESCTKLTSVMMGTSLTKIGPNAFAGCSSLQSVKIGNSVRQVGHYAFSGCHSLTKIVLPASVREIGNGAFQGCKSLLTISSLNTTPPSAQEDSFDEFHYTTSLLQIPAKSEKKYHSDDCWELFQNLNGLNDEEIIALGISPVSIEQKSSTAFTLSGAPATENSRGIIIQGGKKLLRK